MTRAELDAREAAFLVELSELTRRHKLIISGCGCCGSPSLTPIDDDELGDSFRYSSQSGGVCDFEWTDEPEVDRSDYLARSYRERTT